MSFGIEQWLVQAGPSLALPAIFVIVALESSAFLGLLVPGEVAALLAGVLAGAGVFTLQTAFAVVAGAAIVGDLSGYALGRRFGRQLLSRWNFARRAYERHRRRLERYFARWGSATVFGGRFVAVGRAFAPFMAGLSRMRLRSFLPMALASGILWSAALVGLGYLLGGHWHLVEGWLRSLGAGMAVVVALAAVTVLLWRWALAHQAGLTARWERIAGRYGLRTEPLVEFIRARLSPRGYLGLHFTVGLIAVIAAAWLFGGIVQDIFAQDPLVRVDSLVAGLIASHRTPALGVVMAIAGFLGNRWWLIAIVALAAAGAAYARDAAPAIVAVPILAGAYVLAWSVQALFSEFSPMVPASKVVHGFAGFPSITLAGATAAYAAVAYAIVRHTATWRWQTLTVAAAIYLVVLVGLAALYGGELLSAVLGGFALGGFWFAFCLLGTAIYNHLRAGAA